MQAVRQCSACAGRAAGGHLGKQTDAPLLRSNKSVIRRASSCVRFLSSSESVFSSRKPGAQRVGDWTAAAHMSIACLSVSSGPRAFTSAQQVENLSHDSLIKRAASVVTDGSSTFLSQTTSALIDALTDYSQAVYTRIAVQRRYLASYGKLRPAEEDSLKAVLNSHRALASDRLDECKRFESAWINAVNLCKMAAESAHMSGAEQASMAVRANIQVAQSQVQEARKLSADADKKLAETKVEEIQTMAEYAAFREDGEEHELHEAYLRED